MIKIIECPRDAMQGLHQFIPTEKKIKYIQQLLEVGFHVLDCGSFVSPKAVPQMQDTAEVLEKLEVSNSKTQLSVIVGNASGAEKAAANEKVDILGFPFSVSEEFQIRNTNATRQEGFERILDIQEICKKNNKELMIYISMGFGNPYGEAWSTEIVEEWVEKLNQVEVKTINLSDTVGTAETEDIATLFSDLIPKYKKIEFGAHFHSTYNGWRPKIETAFDNGCRRIDGAIQGYGGCPMSGSDLLGNIPTEKLISFLNEKKIPNSINSVAFESSFNKALTLFEGQ